MKMSERIRRARRKADLTQAALATRLDVRRSAISNWESVSDIQPALQNLVAMSKICGVSFEWLATGRGAMAPAAEVPVEIQAADAELVDAQDERELLAMFRNLPRNSKQLVVALVETLQASRRRFKQE